jgi:hypothetical protein
MIGMRYCRIQLYTTITHSHHSFALLTEPYEILFFYFDFIIVLQVDIW